MLKRYFNLLKNIRNWQVYFKVKRNPDVFFLMKGKNKIQFWLVEEIIPIFKEIYMQDIYQIKFLRKELSTQEPIIVDIGANAGYAATFFFQFFPKARILSFEPLPTNFELLSKNQQENAHLHWEIIPKAVGDCTGSTQIFYCKSKEITPVASILQNFDAQNTDNLSVEMISLQDIFQEYALPHIDLLKVDCEGAEYDILYATPKQILDKVRCIVMETHFCNKVNANQDAMKNFLQKQGFEVKTQKEMLWAWRK